MARSHLDMLTATIIFTVLVGVWGSAPALRGGR